jgi:hypothetical protein
MLVQLRMAVASLQYQGLWRAGKGDRPPSRAMVGAQNGVINAVVASPEVCQGCSCVWFA